MAEVELGQIDRPSLIVWGDQDPFVGPKLGDRLADTIPGSRLVRLPGTGRLVPEEAPETLANMILEFVGAAGMVRASDGTDVVRRGRSTDVNVLSVPNVRTDRICVRFTCLPHPQLPYMAKQKNRTMKAPAIALAVRGSSRRVVPAHHAVWCRRFRSRASAGMVRRDDGVHDRALSRAQRASRSTSSASSVSGSLSRRRSATTRLPPNIAR